MPDDRPVPSPPTNPATLWARADAVIEQWHAGEPPDAAAALRDDPALATDRQIVVHLAYEEFALRQEAGERVSVAGFVARFSACKASLERVLTVDEVLKSLGAARPRQPDRWPAPGEVLLEQFEVVREIGRGGFARVYLAREPGAGDRGVVLKVSAAAPDEARALGAHPHPHIVPLYNAPPVKDLSVIVMPFLGTETAEDACAAAWPIGGLPPRTGADLLVACRAVVAAGDPPLPDPAPGTIAPAASFATAVARVGAGLADALAGLHAKGLFHRDLKPSNVLLAPTGHPYLLDFNLSARDREAPAAVAGTIPYMAPEQLAAFAGDGPKEYDQAAADVYALGVILYELLTGRHPFRPGDRDLDPKAVVRELRTAQARGPAHLRNVGRLVSRVVERCLAAEPTERPTAAAVAVGLRRAATRRPLNRPLVFAALGALAVVGSAGAMIPWIAPPSPAAAPTDPFERGVAFLDAGDHGLAAREFLKAGQATGDARAYAYTAYCYARSEEYDKAVWCSDQAVAYGATHPVVFANRACAYSRRDRADRALQDSNTALAANSALFPALHLRALSVLQMHQQKLESDRIPQAIIDINRVRQADDRGPEPSLIAAELYAARVKADPSALELGVAAAKEAIDRGAGSKHLANNAGLAPLAKHPVFIQLIKAGHPKQVTLPPELLTRPDF